METQALPVGRLEELVPETLESVAVLQNLLAMEVAALQNQDVSAGNLRVGAGVSHTDVVGVAETRPGVEVWQEVPEEEVQVVVDAAASVAGAEAVDLLPHGHPFDAVEVHAESHPSALGRELLPYSLAYFVVAGLVGLPGTHQVPMVVEARQVRSGVAKHLQLGQWGRKVEQEVVGV